MNAPKKFFALAIFMLAGVFTHAQTVSVTKSTERIKGIACDGYATELTGTIEEVTAAFSKYLKTLGKVKTTGTQFQVSEVQINLTRYTAPLHAFVKGKGAAVSVWMGTVESDSTKNMTSALEKQLYNFGVQFYKDKIQSDVNESLQAQAATEKQQQKLVLQGKNLASRLAMNEKEKLRLEKSLADNKLAYDKLLLAIEQNKKSQDSVAVATEQIKKMVEMHKERQKKVN
jgi:hypothetical protein